jgi:hypothetical protein
MGGIDHGGDAHRELEVVDVLDLLRQGADVRVQVDHARHHVLALGLDDAVARHAGAHARALRRDGIEGDHLRDHVPLDHDVVRPGRRSAVPRDHHGIADHERLVRTGTQVTEGARHHLGSGRSGRGSGSLLGRRRQGEQGGDQCERGAA